MGENQGAPGPLHTCLDQFHVHRVIDLYILDGCGVFLPPVGMWRHREGAGNQEFESRRYKANQDDSL